MIGPGKRVSTRAKGAVPCGTSIIDPCVWVNGGTTRGAQQRIVLEQGEVRRDRKRGGHDRSGDHKSGRIGARGGPSMPWPAQALHRLELREIHGAIELVLGFEMGRHHQSGRCFVPEKIKYNN
jgi:hypothetical protein